MNATSEIYYVQARSKAVSSFVWDMLSLRDDINFDLNGTAESHLCSVSLCCTNYFFFYGNLQGESPDTEIGRVYVEDPDDWDLPDKQFFWTNSQQHPFFKLNVGTGMITMLSGTPDGNYQLHFSVSFSFSRCVLILGFQCDMKVAFPLSGFFSGYS